MFSLQVPALSSSSPHQVVQQDITATFRFVTANQLRKKLQHSHPVVQQQNAEHKSEAPFKWYLLYKTLLSVPSSYFLIMFAGK